MQHQLQYGAVAEFVLDGTHQALVFVLGEHPAFFPFPLRREDLVREDRYRGRVFGAVGTTPNLMAIAEFGAGSALGDVVGVVTLLNLTALLYICASALALLRLRSVSEARSRERSMEAGATL